ncbi:MAG: hypothetical protein GY940_17925 [bacterium]|nr:hypothetical protein [bacterium]
MTRAEIKQTNRMKWVLFYIFIGIFVVIVAGTIMVVFFGYGQPTEVERDILFKVFIGEIGLAVMALFKVLFGLKKKPVEDTPVPKVSGKYKYEINFNDNKKVFLGECRIKQEGRTLTINGEQKKSKVGRKKTTVSIHWRSNWAELCADNKIRLDYSFAVNGGTRGYAILDAGLTTFKEILGEFHLLHEPYDCGTIKFKRA